MNSFEIALRTKQLPAKIEELVPISFIGTEAVKFYQSKLRLINTLELSEEQKQKTLKDGQDAGILLLEIEAKIGGFLRSKIPDDDHTQIRFHDEPDKSIMNGMKRKHRLNSRTISRNPEIVKETIKEAIENEDIPTKTAVLNKIKYKKEVEKRKNFEKVYPVDDKPHISEFLENCINHQLQINGVLKQILKYQEQCDPSRLEYFVKTLMRTIEIIKQHKGDNKCLKFLQ